MVIKSTTAHIFHVGDCRIYRVAGKALEQLTDDHRIIVSPEQTYLGRALGINPQIEIDYQALQVETGRHLPAGDRRRLRIRRPPASSRARSTRMRTDLDRAAKTIVEEAYRRGSDDNITVQILRIDEVPQTAEPTDIFEQHSELPLPPLPEPRALFDGYRIVREMHGSSRSHIYLAVDTETEEPVALKMPSIDLRDDPAYLKRFMMEEWIARRIDSPHVLKPLLAVEKAQLSLRRDRVHRRADAAQWMIDNPTPRSRNRPRHRRADRHGPARLPPHGDAASGPQARQRPDRQDRHREDHRLRIGQGRRRRRGRAAGRGRRILGTVQYTAPEYFLGRRRLAALRHVLARRHLLPDADRKAALWRPDRQDHGAIGRIGKLTISFRRRRRPQRPASGSMARSGKRAASRSLQAPRGPVRVHLRARHANPAYLSTRTTPLIERNPLLFWKLTTVMLACAVVALLALLRAR